MGAHAPDTAPDLRAKRPHTVAPRYWMGCHNPEPHDVITQAKSPVREFRTRDLRGGCAVMRIPTATSTRNRDAFNFLTALSRG